MKAFAEKEVKVEKLVGATNTTTVTTTTMKGEKLEVKIKSKDVLSMKSEIGTTTMTQMGKEMKLKFELKDECDHGIEGKVGTTAPKIMKGGGKERGKRKTGPRTEAQEEDDNQKKQKVGTKPIAMVKRKAEVETKSEDEDDGSRVKLEGITDETPVKKGRWFKRSLGIVNEEMDIKLEDVGMTMADRVKRRRRR